MVQVVLYGKLLVLVFLLVIECSHVDQLLLECSDLLDIIPLFYVSCCLNLMYPLHKFLNYMKYEYLSEMLY